MEVNYIFIQFVKVVPLRYVDSVENGNVSISDPRIIKDYFPSKRAADEMIVDPMHELLICRTEKGIYVDTMECIEDIVC